MELESSGINFVQGTRLETNPLVKKTIDNIKQNIFLRLKSLS